MSLASVWAAILANWQPVVLALVAIDSAILPIFPNAGILKSIQVWLLNAEKL